jgi:hypothetical protein
MTSRTVTKQVSTTVPPNPRLSFAITATIFVLTAAFFAAHQAWSTGFFLPSFTPIQAALLYSSILYGILVTNTEVIGLREDRIQIVNVIGAGLWTVTTAWLFFSFPFDFAHLAAVVPWPFQFLVTWITNGIGQAGWFLFFLGSAAFIPFFAFQLKRARRKWASGGRTD